MVVAGVGAGFFAAGAGVLVDAGSGCFSEVFVTAAAVGWAAVLATVRLVTAVVTAARGAIVVVVAVAAAGGITPFVLAGAAGCVTAVLATGAPTAPLAFAFAPGVQGAAALAVAAAGFFLRANIDPRFEIAAEALVTVLLAVAFCTPAEFATLVSVPDVVAPGGQGCPDVAIIG